MYLNISLKGIEKGLQSNMSEYIKYSCNKYFDEREYHESLLNLKYKVFHMLPKFFISYLFANWVLSHDVF